MKTIKLICLASLIAVSGCAKKTTSKGYLVNCSSKTVEAPLGEAYVDNVSLIKKNINFICLRNIGLVNLTNEDLSKLK